MFPPPPNEVPAVVYQKSEPEQKAPTRARQIVELTERVKKLFDDKGFNPLERLIECANKARDIADSLPRTEDDSSICLQAISIEKDILKELAQYVSPKIRPVDIADDKNQPIIVNITTAKSRHAEKSIELAVTPVALPSKEEDLDD